MNCRGLFLSVVVLVAVVDERSAQNYNIEERINYKDHHHEVRHYVQWYKRRLRLAREQLAREQLARCSTCLMPSPPLSLAEEAYTTLPRMSGRGIHSMVKYLTIRDCPSEPNCDFNILSKIGENSSPKLIAYPESVRMGELQKGHAGFGRTVTWKTPTCVDPDNGDYVKINSDDEESGSFFSEGNHKIHYTATDFRGGTASLYIEFDVTVIECRADMHVQNGHNSCRNKRVTFGDRCSFHCDRGYRLIGSVTLKCEKNAEFSSEKPVCEPIKCPDLQLPVGGLTYNCTGGSLFDSRCFLLCNRIAGYTLNRTEADEWKFYPGATLCLENGTWSTEPTCRDDEPPQFTNCPIGPVSVFAEPGKEDSTVTWLEIHAEDNVDTDLTIVHTVGPVSGSRFSVGDSQIRYEVTDKAGNRGSSCIFYVHVELQQCDPPVLSDPYLDVDCTPNLILGAKCVFSCRLGLTRTGSSRAECVINNNTLSWSWSNQTLPHCQREVCANLSKPEHGEMSCDKWIGGQMCSLKCDEGYLAPRGYPQMWVCAHKTGEWRPSLFPKCIPEQQPVGLTIFVFMTISTNCTADENFSKAVRMFILESDGIMALCPQCRIGDVKSRCFVRGGRETAKVRVTLINDVRDKPISVYESQLLSVAKGMEDGLKGRNLPEILSKETHFRKSSLMLVCPDGFLPSGTACAGCPPGTMFQPHNSNCSLCPEGFYQDKVGQSTCEQCPQGTSTLSPGANNCRMMCDIGQYYDVDTGNCEECPVGTYQNKKGSVSCISCGDLKTTLNKGSDNYMQCKEKCSAGTRSNTGLKPCTVCEKGFFQDKSGETQCYQCPNATTTLHVGSRSHEECLKMCDRGQYYDVDTGNCEECPVGTYQNKKGSVSCISCGVLKTTLNKGSDNYTKCKEKCSAGTRSNTGLKPCTVCEKGFFQDKSGETQCYQCPNATTTLHVGSRSHEECLNVNDVQSSMKTVAPTPHGVEDFDKKKEGFNAVAPTPHGVEDFDKKKARFAETETTTKQLFKEHLIINAAEKETSSTVKQSRKKRKNRRNQSTLKNRRNQSTLKNRRNQSTLKNRRKQSTLKNLRNQSTLKNRRKQSTLKEDEAEYALPTRAPQ